MLSCWAEIQPTPLSPNTSLKLSALENMMEIPTYFAETAGLQKKNLLITKY
jgi:hypothetical protein